MSLKNVAESASGTMKKAAFKLDRKAPGLLVVGGLVAMTVGSIWAIKKTKKATEVKEQGDKNLEFLKENMDPNLSEKEQKTELVKAKAKNFWEVTKIYVGPAALYIGGATAVLAGYGKLTKFLGEVSSAAVMYKSISDRMYNNAKEMYGEDVARKIRYGIRTEEREFEETDENGKTKKKKETVEVMDDSSIGASDYAKFFDSSSNFWTKDANANLLFLKKAQDIAQKKLVHQGFLFLNDVYRMLDIAPTPQGQVVGWIYDPKREHTGDNKVSFGIYDQDGNPGENAVKRRFINGYESVILLDFNVDGPIIDDFQKYAIWTR